MSSSVEHLLEMPAFTAEKESGPAFLDALRESTVFHEAHCAFYGAFLKANSFNGIIDESADLPPLPIGIFKERRLASVPEEEIVKVTHSSATTSGKPSTILIDKTTRERQRFALSKIMRALLGNERRPFVIFDSRETLSSANGDLSSRATTIRGLLSFSSGFYCVLDDTFSLDKALVEKALEGALGRRPVFFGVTTLLYEVLQKYKHDADFKRTFSKFDRPSLVWSGGWKKLASQNITEEEFKNDIADFFSVEKGDMMDFYGMIEQPGVIYPECEYGFKHVPTYSRVIMRDLRTMRPLGPGSEGMIEVISPLAHSYPGIALLTDDLGVFRGESGCACGRKGQYFSFTRRAPQAEAKGCADTLEMPV